MFVPSNGIVQLIALIAELDHRFVDCDVMPTIFQQSDVIGFLHPAMDDRSPLFEPKLSMIELVSESDNPRS
ncbi:hypothetical protein C485_08142 [Natrinema altunense JCM 12890]|uniref:Uncharacterized protein n=1 Tax=Natrinema altunense (strain JCM 12890 / CGMCC 1.3731 / AJ2) TaxID=1227494 RepID=L9ZLE7_NATA2|nr:hypothetical protein C485_08142 [Natrinema altunense JCM 12890]